MTPTRNRSIRIMHSPSRSVRARSWKTLENFADKQMDDARHEIDECKKELMLAKEQRRHRQG
jgi:ribulose bisphosphate carboxylase small subunit